MEVRKVVLGADDLVGKFVLGATGGEWTPGRGVGIGLADYAAPVPKLLAGVVFDSYNKASVQMHVAAVPGARWMTRAFLWTCFHYPFEQLKVNKILGPVGSANTAARRFDEHLGFVLETALKDAHPDGDLLIYSMTRDQCRFLNLQIPDYHGQVVRTTGS